MDNKVGNKPLSPEKLADLKQRLTEIVNELKAHGILLSSSDRTTLSRPRHGSEPYVRQMTEVVTKHNLEHSSVSVEGIKNDLALSEAYASILPILQEGTLIAEDTINQAKSEYWEGFLFYNGVVQGMSSRLPELAADGKPFESFMSTGPRKKKANSTEK